MFNLGNAKSSQLSKKEDSNKYFVEKYDCDMSNENDSHVIVIKNSLGASKILDVGCGVGFIGKKIKELETCDIDGIEIDEEAASLARKTYDRVFTFSIDSESEDRSKFFKEAKKYDVIILADLLEHIVNPGNLLSELQKKLSDDGKIIVSVPNVAHVDVISNLIDGNFNYNKTGILDSTHVRFFTENSFYDFIRNINENYKLELSVKCVSKTYAKESDIDDAFLFSVMDKEMYLFQNVFIVKKNGGRIPKKNKNDFYHSLNSKYLELKNAYDKNENEIRSLKAKIENLNNDIFNQKSEIENLKKELNGVYNSKSWRVTAPLRKVSEKMNNK